MKPRIRSVKPQFWLDENLGTVCRDARLMYIGLWNLADDQGVFEWRPARIKIQLFPYDTDIKPKDIEEWLALLLNIKDIVKFDNNGHQFGYIRSFLEHQEIKKPSQWTFAKVPEAKETMPRSGVVVGEEGGSSNPAVPLGSREGGVGSRFKGVGSKKKKPIKKRHLQDKDLEHYGLNKKPSPKAWRPEVIEKSKYSVEDILGLNPSMRQLILAFLEEQAPTSPKIPQLKQLMGVKR